jgi:type IV secretory pathway VirD2 relaxase
VSGQDDFTPRLGRLRDLGAGDIRRGSAAIRKFAARLNARAAPTGFRGRHIGRGNGALPSAARTPRGFAARHMRRVTVKVHIARAGRIGGRQAFGAHVRYVQRDGVDRDGRQGQLYDRDGERADGKAFLERSSEDRHQFRLIVSPEDGTALGDLKATTRQLMKQMEQDVGTPLDWVAVDHHNTGHPHSHVIVRGRGADGADLIIAPDYLMKGLRGRAQQVVTETLGPRRDMDIANAARREVGQDRFTGLDRELSALAQGGEVSILGASGSADRFRQALQRQRLRHLEGLHLAEKTEQTTWRLRPGWERALQAMGRRGDIIRSLSAGLSPEHGSREVRFLEERGADRAPFSGLVLSQGPIDELRDARFLIVEDMKGTAWYVPARNLGLGEMPPKGAVVEVGVRPEEARKADHVIAGIAERSGGLYSDALHLAADPASSSAYRLAHKRRLEALRRSGIADRRADGVWDIPQDYLARAAAFEASKGDVSVRVRSWMALESQVSAKALTWLDDVGAAGDMELSERVLTARRARLAFLQQEGLLGPDVQALSNAVRAQLRSEELGRAEAREARRSGRSQVTTGDGQAFEGKFERTVDLAQGRMALVGNEKTFALVPWQHDLERYRGQSLILEQKAKGTGWTFQPGRARGISR